jgi:Na+/proline symporter
MLATARWERLLTLAPLFVVGIGLIAAVLILLGRALADSVRDVQNKTPIVIGGVVVIAFVIALTILGVNLPKE